MKIRTFIQDDSSSGVGLDSVDGRLTRPYEDILVVRLLGVDSDLYTNRYSSTSLHLRPSDHF